MRIVRHFWEGFFKQATSSGAVYRRDLAVDDAIHSMQEDTYPEGTYSFFDPDKSVADAVDASNAGQPPNWIKPDALTLGYAEAL